MDNSRHVVADGVLGEGRAADDYAALHYTDGRFVEADAERPDATTYVVTRSGGRAEEREVPARLLS